MNKVILQPCGSSAAAQHYADTVHQPVKLVDLLPLLTTEHVSQLHQIYPAGECYVWGLTPGKNEANVSKWQRIQEGDVTVFSAKGKIFASAVVTYKLRNATLAQQLWGTNEENQTWEYVYFLDEVRPVNIPYANFNAVVGYAANFIIQGFALLDSNKSEQFFAAFGLRSEVFIEPVDQVTYEQLQDKLDALEETDAAVQSKRRLEQGFLKRHLFGRRTTATCGICAQQYPISFLVAAHIKRRSACLPAERKDLNVVMPLCKFGCDELFERGYIAVQDGKVMALPQQRTTAYIQGKVAELENKRCTYFTPASAGYFQWHIADHSQ